MDMVRLNDHWEKCVFNAERRLEMEERRYQSTQVQAEAEICLLASTAQLARTKADIADYRRALDKAQQLIESSPKHP
jgi:hypothetical protein